MMRLNHNVAQRAAALLLLSLSSACASSSDGMSGPSGGSTSKTGGASNASGGSGAKTGGAANVGGTSGAGGSSMAAPKGPAAVNLGTASNFVILAKSGIDTVPPSVITGNLGVSPIGATGLTGFSLMADAAGTFSKSSQITGMAFAADYASPTPASLTTAVSNMETAFTDAAGRTTPDSTELGAGDISGKTLVPGLYKWGTGILISTDVTLAGGPNDVWIFQIAGGITQAPGAKVLLSGGANPKNIYWQTFGSVALGTGAHLEGIVLSQTEITLGSGASVNGRLLSQTAVTLNASTIKQPAP